LIHEALDKIIKNDDKIDATVMLITAGVGLICNISMGHILHSSVVKLFKLGRTSFRRRKLFPWSFARPQS
jgi:hypothetical protein